MRLLAGLVVLAFAAARGVPFAVSAPPEVRRSRRFVGGGGRGGASSHGRLLRPWHKARADKALATLEARRELRAKLNTMALAESMRARLEGAGLGGHRVLGGLTRDQGDVRRARNAAKRARRAIRARGGQAGNRELGLACDIAAISRCDELWLVGERVSPGMRAEADAARLFGVTVVDRTLAGRAEPPT